MKITLAGDMIYVTIMKHMTKKGYDKAFALPTVLIASVVMLAVLLSGLISASSVNTSLKQQYSNRLISQAADAGLTMAKACVEKGGGIFWSNAQPLKPNTNCSGAELFSCTGATPPATCYVVSDATDTTTKTTFTVGLTGTNNVDSKGTIVKTRASSPSTIVSSQDTQISAFMTSKQLSYSIVMGVGYQYTCALNPSGQVWCSGIGTLGRLGDANMIDRTSPVLVVQGQRPTSSVTFKSLSVGANGSCAIGSDNEA